MTEIEKKALALLNEVCEERCLIGGFSKYSREEHTSIEAVCRAIEAHEAFRREVSDVIDGCAMTPEVEDRLSRFIIPKPVDPLVEALIKGGIVNNGAAEMAADIRAALAKRGGRVVFEGEG